MRERTRHSRTAAASRGAGPVDSALPDQVRLELGGLGLSLVLPDQELLYARVAGICARATLSKVRATAELRVRSIQASSPVSHSMVPCPCPSPSFMFRLTCSEHPTIRAALGRAGRCAQRAHGVLKSMGMSNQHISRLCVSSGPQGFPARGVAA